MVLGLGDRAGGGEGGLGGDFDYVVILRERAAKLDLTPKKEAPCRRKGCMYTLKALFETCTTTVTRFTYGRGDI